MHTDFLTLNVIEWLAQYLSQIDSKFPNDYLLRWQKLISHFKKSTKILEKINISKAAGPDLIPGRMLNMLSPELAPIVHDIFYSESGHGKTTKGLVFG